MTDAALIAAISILTAGLTVSFGALGPALGEGRAASAALTAIAQQPDSASTLSRTLFVSLAMVVLYAHLMSLAGEQSVASQRKGVAQLAQDA